MFAVATSIEGDIVLMDEWIAVGDESFQRKASERLRKITSGAGILVLASHDMSLLKGTCNLGLCLEAGKVRYFGPIDEAIQEMRAATRTTA
jgi:ABC-2 type transport system ATP-binding protein/lipopolysaccharide transport system ATP-binding protein